MSFMLEKQAGNRIAGKYLAELMNLSRECGFDEGAQEFARLRSEEIRRSISDQRSTRRIPAWELQNLRDTLAEAIQELAAIEKTGQVEKIEAVRLKLRYIDDSLSPWTKTRRVIVISADGEETE
jgi:hypothetical protein